MNEIVIKTVKSLSNQRVRLDVVKQQINKLPKSRGTSLAFTALERGRMWIGEICGELGNQYPYEKTKEATDASGIQAAVDLGETIVSIDPNEIIALNQIREEIEKECETFVGIAFGRGDLTTFSPIGVSAFKIEVAIHEAYKGLKEARMWAGIRLGEIRDSVQTTISTIDKDGKVITAKEGESIKVEVNIKNVSDSDTNIDPEAAHPIS